MQRITWLSTHRKVNCKTTGQVDHFNTVSEMKNEEILYTSPIMKCNLTSSKLSNEEQKESFSSFSSSFTSPSSPLSPSPSKVTSPHDQLMMNGRRSSYSGARRRRFSSSFASTPYTWTAVVLLAGAMLCLLNVKFVQCHNHHSSDSSDHLLVSTKKGLVRGITVTTPTGKKVDAFLGIPYAMAPIGKYRFRHPKPIDPWTGVFNASVKPSACYQVTDTFFGEDFRGSVMWNPNTPLSEDCLKINIWVPHPRSKSQSLAVLLWVFGGGFYSGSASLELYDGRILASEENIIVISINYRVASLGFLFLDHEDAPGNAGMFDQLMAMEWIHENIAAFGGNPENITLFGESAGAVSIAFHLLSPLSRNFFSQAIMQSGSAACPWGVIEHKEAIRRSLNLAEAVGCPHSMSKVNLVIDCLRRVNPLDLVSNETGDLGVAEFLFVPIVDGSFLDEPPSVSLMTKNFKKTNILIGSNQDEGNYFIVFYLSELFKKTEEVYISREDFVKTVRELNPTIGTIGQNSIIYEYTEWLDPDDAIKNRDAVDKMVGDYSFTCPCTEMANRYSLSGCNVYYYYFNHRSSYSPWPKWMGVLHGDEINFIFGEPLEPKYGYSPQEVELSRRMMNYWANFAKTGNPTQSLDGRWPSVFWPVHTAHGKEYFTLSTNNSATIGRGPRAKQCAFWQTYLPQLLKDVAKSTDQSMATCSGAGVNDYSTGIQVTLIIILTICIIVLLTMSYFAFKWRRSADATT